MTYLRIQWRHTLRDEPVLFFVELDGERRETRKVEIFADGEVGFADAAEEASSTRLSDLPVPSLKAIVADPQFEAVEITEPQFAQAWEKRKSPRLDPNEM